MYLPPVWLLQQIGNIIVEKKGDLSPKKGASSQICAKGHADYIFWPT